MASITFNDKVAALNIGDSIILVEKNARPVPHQIKLSGNGGSRSLAKAGRSASTIKNKHFMRIYLFYCRTLSRLLAV